jgi:hypothetical protein
MFLLNPKFLLVHRNRYLEGMDDRQKTPRGHPDFNSYVKILRVFIFQTDRRTDEQTDRQAEKLIRCELGNLIGSSRFISLSVCLSVRLSVWNTKTRRFFTYEF